MTLWLGVPTEDPAPGWVGSVDSGAWWPGFELPLRDLGKSHNWSGLSALQMVRRGAVGAGCGGQGLPEVCEDQMREHTQPVRLPWFCPWLLDHHQSC